MVAGSGREGCQEEGGLALQLHRDLWLFQFFFLPLPPSGHPPFLRQVLSIAQAVLKLNRVPSASACQVLELKMYATMPGLIFYFLIS